MKVRIDRIIPGTNQPNLFNIDQRAESRGYVRHRKEGSTKKLGSITLLKYAGQLGIRTWPNFGVHYNADGGKIPTMVTSGRLPAIQVRGCSYCCTGQTDFKIGKCCASASKLRLAAADFRIGTDANVGDQQLSISSEA